MAFSIRSLKTVTGCGDVGTALEIQQLGIFNLLADEGDSSFLQIACQNQQVDMVDLILAQPGIIVDYQNASGVSALHDAVRQNHPEIVLKLFKAGASPNLRTGDRGETPLMMLLRLTIEKQLPNDGKNDEKNTSEEDLHTQIKTKENEIMETIKEFPPDLQNEIIAQYRANGLFQEKKEENKVNYELFDLLINHPDTDLSITGLDQDANSINLLDYLVDSKYENHQLMEYLLTKLLEKKVILDLTETFQTMLVSPDCNCGGDHHRYGSIFYFEDLLRLGYIHDLEGQKFYFWIVKKIKNHSKREEILKLLNQYVDRSNLYQENPNPQSCSILEVLLENQDLETIRKLHHSKDGVPLAVNRVCQQHGLTPFIHWLKTRPIQPLSVETFVKVYELIIDELGGISMTYKPYQPTEIAEERLKKEITILFTENQITGSSSDFYHYLLLIAKFHHYNLESIELKESFREYVTEMGASEEQIVALPVKFLELIKNYIIPNLEDFYDMSYQWFTLPFFKLPDNLPIFKYVSDKFKIELNFNSDENVTRAEIIASLRAYMYPHLIKTIILQLKDQKSDLIINQNELVSHEPIEQIPDQDMVIMTNGVVWDQNNLIGYITHNAKGINQFDEHIPLESLRGQPIWSEEDYQNIFTRDDPKFRQLCDYLNFFKYSENFTAVEKENLRRFTSIFWARGAWWGLEIKKILSAALLQEWEKVKKNIGPAHMPRSSDELSHQLYNLKARYLHLYRDFYNGLSEQTREAMEELNSALTVDYSEQVIKGNECIMCYGSSLAKLLAKLKIDLDFCQPQILGETTNDEELVDLLKDIPRDK